MNRSFQMLTLKFRKTVNQRWILQRQVLNGIASHVVPTLNQQTAESAFPVINHQMFFRWGGDSISEKHGTVIASFNQNRQQDRNACEYRKRDQGKRNSLSSPRHSTLSWQCEVLQSALQRHPHQANVIRKAGAT